MRIFCMCRSADVVRDNDDTLTLRPLVDGDPVGIALPELTMYVEEIGVEQFIVDTDEGRCNYPSMVGVNEQTVTSIRQHFPNIDIRTCLMCGARIALEG